MAKATRKTNKKKYRENRISFSKLNKNDVTYEKTNKKFKKKRKSLKQSAGG